MAVDGFVLVHGGYHGAWCWDAVRPLLSLPSVAVDLPGRGARADHAGRVTLQHCVDAVVADADAAGFDRFILVGHSMGGLTVTETTNARPERVAHRVYVAALAPPPGVTVSELYGAPDVTDPAGKQPLLDEAVAHQMFAGDLDPQQFAEAHAKCAPEASGLFVAGVSGYDSRVPATYVRCERDVAVPSAMADAMIGQVQPVRAHSLDSDHDVMLSHPEMLARVLDEVAAHL